MTVETSPPEPAFRQEQRYIAIVMPSLNEREMATNCLDKALNHCNGGGGYDLRRAGI
jgi:hypothetical protein